MVLTPLRETVHGRNLDGVNRYAYLCVGRSGSLNGEGFDEKVGYEMFLYGNG